MDRRGEDKEKKLYKRGANDGQNRNYRSRSRSLEKRSSHENRTRTRSRSRSRSIERTRNRNRSRSRDRASYSSSYHRNEDRRRDHSRSKYHDLDRPEYRQPRDEKRITEKLGQIRIIAPPESVSAVSTVKEINRGENEEIEIVTE